MYNDNNAGPARATQKSFDVIPSKTVIAESNFQHKSLCCFSCNIATGCCHGCSFCYVPETATIKQEARLENILGLIPEAWKEERLAGNHWGDTQWGNYSFLREWDEDEFKKSLKAASRKVDSLPSDGNRAVMFCTTTDPYQTLAIPGNPGKTSILNSHRRNMVRRSLEMIRDFSDLNVRILTRSPLAVEDFDIYKTFGDRLLFGMSIPTLDPHWSSVYEPHAPGPQAKLRTLEKAVEAGVNIYVALAPTIPDEGESELRETIRTLRKFNPVTLFHEPINLRAENLERIETRARILGRDVRSQVFQSRENWREYAFGQFDMVERICQELSVPQGVLHQWPDKDLASKGGFMKMKQMQAHRDHGSRLEGDLREAAEREWHNQRLPWIQYWHNTAERISAWPGKNRIAQHQPQELMPA